MATGDTIYQGDEVYFTIAESIPFVEYVAKAVKIIDGIYNFGREGETEKAIRLLNERVAALEQAVRDIDERLSELEQRVNQGENRDRWRLITEHQLQFNILARDLNDHPEDADSIAANALDRLRAMFNDEDLWLWSDMLGKPHDAPTSWRPELPYFKGTGLPIFAFGTMVWALAAHTHISRGGAHQIHQPEADELLRWIATRTDWKPYITPPVSIAERFRAAINVEIVVSSKYVKANGNCEYAFVGLNNIDRTRTHLRDVDMYFGQGLPPNTMCTADPRIADIEEAILEEESPYLKILNGIEEIVSRIRHRGTLEDPFIGQFPDWTAHILTLYGIEPSGQLRRYQLKTTTALTEPPTVTQVGGVLGTGWQNFAEVLGTYDVVMYAFSDNGAIDWYREVDFAQVPNGWRGPNRVRAERGAFNRPAQRRYINGGSGTYYLLRSYQDSYPGGFRIKHSLELSVHSDPSNGSGVFRDSSLVAQEFKPYPTLIGGGEGVFFGIDEAGDLYWLKHSSWPNAGTQLEGPIKIGNGWNGFARVLALGYGFIAGIYPSGEMLLYYFQQWQRGPRNEGPIWHGPVRVPGTQWQGFKTLIPMVGSEPAQVR